MTSVTVSPRIRALAPEHAHAAVDALADLLIDCVHGGASVSFMAPLTHARAAAFWRGVADGAASGDRVVLVADDPESGGLLGAVQVVFAHQENQPHRGEIAKMLVRRSARRRGIGAALMRAAEDAARATGRTLLVLDTTSGSDAARLYERLGWVRVGEVPDYALWPEGGLCPTTFYYRRLVTPAA